MKLRITAPARRDIDAVLSWSEARFGAGARARYEALINRGLVAIAASADPLGSRCLDEPHDGIRLYHLRHCRGVGPMAVQDPRHLLGYRRPDPGLVVLLRVLHDAMDIAARLSERP